MQAQSAVDFRFEFFLGLIKYAISCSSCTRTVFDGVVLRIKEFPRRDRVFFCVSRCFHPGLFLLFASKFALSIVG